MKILKIEVKQNTKETDIINKKEVWEICNQDNTKERKGTMAAITKPSNGAFVVSEKKVSAFFEKKAHTSSDAIRRFETKKSKAGTVALKEK